MWECPNVARIDGKEFLLVCPQGVPKRPFSFENIHNSGYFPIKGTLVNLLSQDSGLMGAGGTAKIDDKTQLKDFFEVVPANEPYALEEFVPSSGIAAYDAILDSKGDPLFENQEEFPPSMPRIFKSLGYDTTAIHPNLGSNWNRSTVYDQMGFDTFYDIDAFKDAETYHGDVSDAATYDKTLAVLEGSDDPQFVLDVTMTGGLYRTKSNSCVGAWALRAMESVNVDVSFLGCDGFSAEGPTIRSYQEVELKRAAAQQSRTTVVLADTSKLSNVGLHTFAGYDDFDGVIFERALTAAERERFPQLITLGSL